MAAKRIRCPPSELSDPPAAQRRRTTPPLATVIERVMVEKSFQNFIAIIEPVIRKVVREEIEKGLHHGISTLKRYPSGKRIELTEVPSFKLVFGEGLTLPIFTGSKIEDATGRPLSLLLVDALVGKAYPLPPSLKIEIVVVDGDFASDGRDSWTKEEFDRSVLKEREGRRPLLSGEVSLNMRDGAAMLGDLSITDNSSWVRSRHFRIGARVPTGSFQGMRIQEAISERFSVRDHRGELYKKNHPPALNDEVWRLEKIAKDGAFHQRLSKAGIETVQDFLKLCTVNPQKLRTILGQGMSERMWEVAVGHARECVPGEKLYVYRRPDGTGVVLNSVCEPVNYIVDGVSHSFRSLSGQHKVLLERVVEEAYAKWDDSVVEIQSIRDEPFQSMAILPEDDGGVYSYGNQDGNLAMASSYQLTDFEFNVGAGYQGIQDANYFVGWGAARADYQAASDVQQDLLYKTGEFSSSDDEGSTLSHSFLLN